VPEALGASLLVLRPVQGWRGREPGDAASAPWWMQVEAQQELPQASTGQPLRQLPWLLFPIWQRPRRQPRRQQSHEASRESLQLRPLEWNWNESSSR